MFTKDSRTETFLAQMGVTFRYTNTLTLADLSPGWDQQNLARPVPKREEAVMEYATLMESGSPAPAPRRPGAMTCWTACSGSRRRSWPASRGFRQPT